MTTLTPSPALSEPAVLARVPKELLIAGRWRPAEGRRTLPVEDPATGETIAEVADASPGDAMAALDAAVSAQPAWAAKPPRERGEILRRAYQAIVERTDELALLMTLEMGKPLAESRAEVAYGADFFAWFAGEALRVGGRYSAAPDGSSRMLTMRQPVGPALLITPWNFPLAMATRKIGPAVAAGCTMVLKPAQQTPLCSLAVAQVLMDAGLPPGVLNLVTASSAGEVMGPLISDGRARKLSFTGSTPVGRSLVASSAQRLLRVSMELGGNAPFLVFADADLDGAVEGALAAKMRNMGEACTAANRFCVAEPVAAEFTARLAERMGALKVGRGTDAGVEVGPLIDRRATDKVAELVGDARDHGAQVVVGGEAGAGPGHFWAPTVLAGVSDGARVLSEEIFGPVAPVSTFSDEEEAVAMANRTEMGLVAYLFTRDLGRALRVAEALETGMVGLNRGMVSNPAAPFGGIKQSGLGREGGSEGIHEYLETKYVAVAL